MREEIHGASDMSKPEKSVFLVWRTKDFRTVISVENEGEKKSREELPPDSGCKFFPSLWLNPEPHKREADWKKKPQLMTGGRN